MSAFRWRSSKILELCSRSNGIHLWIFALVVFLSFLAALLEGTSFAFLLTAFSGIQGGKSGFLSSVTKAVFSNFDGIHLFVQCFFLAISSQMLRSFLCFVNAYLLARFGSRVQVVIQSAVYHQILRFSYRFVSNQKVGGLIESARSPAVFIQPMLESINRFLVSLLTSIVISCVMLYLNFAVGSLLLCVFASFLYLQKSIVGKISSSSKEISDNFMKLNQNSSQILQGIKLIHIFSEQENFEEKMSQEINRIGSLGGKMNLFASVIPYLHETVSVLILGIILLATMVFIGSDDQSFLSILMGFLLISYRLSSRVQSALMALGMIGSQYGYLTRANEILIDEDKEFSPVGGVSFEEPIENISVENVTFRYTPSTEEVLKNFSVEIRKGTTVGIVGLSGSGKTSLLDLLLRLYEPTEGRIVANHVDIRTLTLASWRAKFGVVGQDAFLFDDTIEANIRFGMREASLDAIKGAARKAGIEELIRRLPHGYETMVGEKGFRLSGGERQRIALARALLRDSEVLILDEATSNLDSQSEAHIQRAIDSLQREKTMIIVAHRLSTVVRADTILVMERGRMIESGSHESLLKQKGRYAHLWDLQTKKVESDPLLFEMLGKS